MRNSLFPAQKQKGSGLGGENGGRDGKEGLRGEEGEETMTGV